MALGNLRNATFIRKTILTNFTHLIFVYFFINFSRQKVPTLGYEVLQSFSFPSNFVYFLNNHFWKFWYLLDIKFEFIWNQKLILWICDKMHRFRAFAIFKRNFSDFFKYFFKKCDHLRPSLKNYKNNRNFRYSSTVFKMSRTVFKMLRKCLYIFFSIRPLVTL